MISAAKTIQIFLPAGDPQGIRIAEITTRIVQVIEVPRSLLPEFLKMHESTQVALYLLFGEAEDGADPQVYIGQTGDLRARLAAHNKEKEFWQRALVLVSRTNSLTQTHGLFLEWHCLQAARKAGRYQDANGNSGSKPYTPPPLEADCMEIFETGSILLSTLGYPVFAPVARPLTPPAPSAPPPAGEVFYLKVSGADGRGQYTPEGFVVLQGSRGRRQNSPSAPAWVVSSRSRLLQDAVMHEESDAVVFDRDHLFSSPSPAAQALLGRASNGWTAWKRADGKTLNDLKRAHVEPDP
jgi:hypothetical protein